MKVFKYIHLFSLDVCIGAIAYQYYFYQLRANLTIAFPFQVLLFCSIWFAYLMDRIIDVNLVIIKDNRHQYIVKYANQVYILFFILAISVIFAMTKIDLIFSIQGLLLVLGVGVYWIFWINKWFGRYLSKELFTAILYTLGILFPWDSPFDFHFILIAFLFFLIVLHHLKLFLHIAGKSMVKQLVFVEIVICMTLACYVVFYYDKLLVLSPIIFTLGVQLIIRYFYPSGRMRALAEIAYWSPLVLIIYELF